MTKNGRKSRTRSKSSKTAEDFSLPGKYGKIFQEVERDLGRFRKSQQGGRTVTGSDRDEDDT